MRPLDQIERSIFTDSACVLPWVLEVFSRVVRTRTRAATPREKTSGAERFDLLC